MKRRKFLVRTSLASSVGLFFPSLLPGLNIDPEFRKKRPAQNLDKDTVITVTVDTATVNADINEAVIISDNRSENSGLANSFLSEIDKMKKVIWQGQSESGDEVWITKIERKGGAQLLKKDVYTGSTTVEGKVKDKYIDGVVSYNIYFTVVSGGVESSYVIDPKLQMNPS